MSATTVPGSSPCIEPASGKEREYRIGDLLVGAKVVQPELLNKALEVAGTAGTNVGRALVRLNIARQRDVDTAVAVQTMIRDRQLTGEQGVKALRKCTVDGLRLPEAISKITNPGQG